MNWYLVNEYEVYSTVLHSAEYRAYNLDMKVELVRDHYKHSGATYLRVRIVHGKWGMDINSWRVHGLFNTGKRAYASALRLFRLLSYGVKINAATSVSVMSDTDHGKATFERVMGSLDAYYMMHASTF